MKQQTVLFVDDSTAVRRLACSLLRRHGYTVIEAANGLGALEEAQQYRGFIDLLVTDISMPGMNGVALSACLKSCRPGIRVLFMSGSGEPPDGERAFLSKPFTLHALLEAVQSELTAMPMESTAPTQDRAVSH